MTTQWRPAKLKQNKTIKHNGLYYTVNVKLLFSLLVNFLEIAILCANQYLGLDAMKLQVVEIPWKWLNKLGCFLQMNFFF